MPAVQRQTARSWERKSGKRSPERAHAAARPMPAVQRASCACGGGCPRCRQNYPLQAKLEVSQPGDALEQEADRVAEQVLRMPQPEHSDNPEAQKSAGLRLSRYASGTSAQSSPEVPPIVHNVVRSPGEPLDPATRAFMEPRFGHDFSRVRVHSGGAAEQSARGLNANAYTVGHDIVFGAGRFAPGTHEGRRLIAHELTHVVQQSRADGNSVGQSNEKRGLSPSSGLRLQRQTETKSLETAVGPTPNYDSFCDAGGYVRGDAQWLALFTASQNEQQLEQIYQDTNSSPRAALVWQQLEEFYSELAQALAESQFSAPCSIPVARELNPKCLPPDLSKLSIFSSKKAGATRLRDVFTKSYETHARKLGQRNQMIARSLDAILSVYGGYSALKAAAAEERALLKEGTTLKAGEAVSKLKTEFTPEEKAASMKLEQKMAADKAADAMAKLAKEAPDLQKEVASNTTTMADGRTTLKDLAQENPELLKDMYARWKQGVAKGEIKTKDFGQYVKGRQREFRGRSGELEDAFKRGPDEIMVKAPKANVNEAGTDSISYNIKTDRIKLLDNKSVKTDAVVSKVSALEKNLQTNLADDIVEIRKIVGQPGVPSVIGNKVLPRLEAAKAEIDAYILKNKLTPEQLGSAPVQKDFGQILDKHGIDRVVTFGGAGQGAGVSGKLSGPKDFKTE